MTISMLSIYGAANGIISFFCMTNIPLLRMIFIIFSLSNISVSSIITQLLGIFPQFPHSGLLLLLFSYSVVSNSLQPNVLQHARPRCPSPSPEVCPSSCPLHLILCTLFFCPQSFPASGTFPISQLFTSDDQNTGASASALVPPVIFRVDLP